jgi:hypothetical protein
VPATPEVKKYFSSNVPRRQCRYLFEVTRLIVLVHGDRLGHGAQGQRAQVRDAVAKEAVLLLHDLAATLRMVFCRWSSALTSQLASASFPQPGARRLAHAGAAHFHVIAAVDQHAGQGGRVERDGPAAVGSRR